MKSGDDWRSQKGRLSVSRQDSQKGQVMQTGLGKQGERQERDIFLAKKEIRGEVYGLDRSSLLRIQGDEFLTAAT